jgi:hypothetical protein
MAVEVNCAARGYRGEVGLLVMLFRTWQETRPKVTHPRGHRIAASRAGNRIFDAMPARAAGRQPGPMATPTHDTSRTAHLLALMKKGDDAFNARDFAAVNHVHHPGPFSAAVSLAIPPGSRIAGTGTGPAGNAQTRRGRWWYDGPGHECASVVPGLIEQGCGLGAVPGPGGQVPSRYHHCELPFRVASEFGQVIVSAVTGQRQQANTPLILPADP